MAPTKCHVCDIVTNRQGESRPSILCKRCENEYCSKCAKVTVDICTMMKAVDKSFWTCNECEANEADLKAVVESIKMINQGQEDQRAELRAIKKGQEEQRAERAKQQEEREKVLEGLKVVEVMAKKLERIAEKQELQEDRLAKHDDAIDKNARKLGEGENRIKMLEEQVEKIGKNSDEKDMRQFNAVVQEVREIEKREKNFIIFNVQEPAGGVEEEEEGRRDKVKEIFKELSCEEITPKELIRIGKAGKYPRQILTVLHSADECEKILKKCRAGQRLKNEVFITRDRTFKQRQEAKLFRMEKEKEEMNDDVTQPGRGRGGRGRGRPRGGGGGRGGGRGRRLDSTSTSRKRRNSGDAENAAVTEDEVKRQRMGGGAKGGGAGAEAAETNQATQSTPSSELGAVGGDKNF